MARATVEVGALFAGGSAKLIVNDQDITNQVRSFAIRGGVNEVTTLEVEYLCLDGVRFQGVVMPFHQCPIAEST